MKLYPDDIIEFDHPTAGRVEGVIFLILPSGEVQVNTTDHGTLIISADSNITVKDSFFAKLFSSETKAELAALIEKGKTMIKVVQEKAKKPRKTKTTVVEEKAETVVEDF